MPKQAGLRSKTIGAHAWVDPKEFQRQFLGDFRAVSDCRIGCNLAGAFWRAGERLDGAIKAISAESFNKKKASASQ